MATAVSGIVAASAAAGYLASNPKAEREDCPGKIICPISGQLICADECPATEKAVSLPVNQEPACCCSGDAN